MKTNNGTVVLLYYPADKPRVFGPFQSFEEAISVLSTMDVAIGEDDRVLGRKYPCGWTGVGDYQGPSEYSWEVLEDPRLVFG